MPNDNTKTSNTNQTNDIPQVFSEDVLPPMPQNSVVNSTTPNTNTTPNNEVKEAVAVEQKTDSSNSGSAAPSDDINLPPVVMGTTPKKKFGSGKVIATILGLFLLVGGLGAGTLLVQQNQDIREKAGACSDSPCGPGMQCGGLDQFGNPFCVPSGSDDNYSGPQYEPPDDPWSGGGGGEDTQGDGCGSGYRCAGDGWEFCIPSTSTVGCRDAALEKGYTVFLGSSSGNYGSGTWLCPKNHPYGTSCDNNNGGISRTDLNKNSCFCGVLQIDTPTGFESYIGNCGCDGGGEDTPPPGTTTPITASCQNVKAYDEDWTLLTTTQLGQLGTGDTVNFCVAGVATGGSFDKAKFTINGVAQAETTTLRPSSTDFCQSYVIPAGVTSFNVTAQIHHATLGWK